MADPKIPGMPFSQAELDQAIADAREEDEVRSVEGAVAALSPCARHCTVCEGMDHHWMPDFDDAGEPLMACKHCPAWREMKDGDLDGDEADLDPDMLV
jgi:hypothetical protein